MGRPTGKTRNKSGDVETEQQQILSTLAFQQNDPTRIVVLHGDVTEQMISGTIMHLLHLAGADSRPIYLIVSTYGGSVDEMFSLYDTIKFLPCPVHTVALGKVMSAGVLLLAAGEKGKRVIGKSSRLMIHPISAAYGGNVFEIVNDSKEILRQQSQLVKALSSETKMSEDKIQKIMRSGHDYYIMAEEAVKLGIVDKII
jgi:ATP-dependent Clp protease protease subunit